MVEFPQDPNKQVYDEAGLPVEFPLETFEDWLKGRAITAPARKRDDDKDLYENMPFTWDDLKEALEIKE